jgi:hypothetical protein
VRRSHLSSVIPWYQIVDQALLVTVDDGYERVRQISVLIDGIELAGFDPGGDDAPVCDSRVVARFCGSARWGGWYARRGC